ncbi:transcription termination/antitermination protein NusG [Tropicimonas isoalkanivorans]|uniref:Transcriptional antiterminator RfaH n=1 Tax=Tropicimonas isoalkanivorans TaxID=441112 RepID=A0A1I1EHX9_9RHOB|nr:transcription termination/antitermination NusG family protein [Tropicimonas isoalkanivorans]SFB86671.1 transcriptional antiterminator RfaH [Tropicimonas isoalkanivorans]
MPTQAIPIRESDHDWYVAQLKPNGLARALTNLHRQQVSTFVPRHRETIRRANRLVTREAPLFPGYLFVRAESDGVWRKINNTHGVARLVMRRPDTPQPVPQGIIRALMDATDSDGTVRHAAEFAEGDMVRIKSGPMVDFVGRVASLPDQQRVFVLLEIMGHSVRTEVPRQAIRRMSG